MILHSRTIHSAMMMAYKIEADFQYIQQTAGIFPKYFADPKQSYGTNTKHLGSRVINIETKLAKIICLFFVSNVLNYSSQTILGGMPASSK